MKVSPASKLTGALQALITTHKADLVALLTTPVVPIGNAPSIEAQLVGLIAELAEITGDFTDADRREALEVAINSQIGPEGWRDYLRDLLIPEERERRPVH